MLRIGLTGGIGSGKSTVARIFKLMGIPVFDADSAAKTIMNEDEALKKEMVQHFGKKTYINGMLDRNYLASMVFENERNLATLNALVHPAVFRAAEAWMQQQNTAYVIKEAALIFESGSQEELDIVIGVYAPKHLRIQRTMQRDHSSRESVIQRMNNQINEEMKMKLCDFVICNDEQTLLIPQVLALHKQLLLLSKNTSDQIS